MEIRQFVGKEMKDVDKEINALERKGYSVDIADIQQTETCFIVKAFVEKER